MCHLFFKLLEDSFQKVLENKGKVMIYSCDACQNTRLSKVKCAMASLKDAVSYKISARKKHLF